MLNKKYFSDSGVLKKTLIENSTLIFAISFLIILCKESIGSSNFQSDFRSPLTLQSALYGIDGNPSLLVSQDYPLWSVQMPLSFYVQFGNNQIVVPEISSLFNSDVKLGNWVAKLLIESFDIRGNDPDKVSQTITQRLHQGINIESSAGVPFFAIAKRGITNQNIGIGCSFTTKSQAVAHIPGAPLGIIFSPTQGLQKGNILSFGGLQTHLSLVSDLHISSAMPISYIAPLKSKLLIGVGGIYRIGHALFALSLDKGDISFSDENILSIKGQGSIITTGTGLHSKYGFGNPFNEGVKNNGYGFGLNAGLLLLHEKYSWGISIQEMGLMKWNNGLYQANLLIKGDTLSILSLLNESTEFTFNPGILNKRSKSFYESFPTDFYLHGSKKWTRQDTSTLLSKMTSQQTATLYLAKPLARSINIPLNYKVGITLENNFYKNRFPVRIGWEKGGLEGAASFFEAECIDSGATYSLWYRSSGSYSFLFKHGGEFGVRLRVHWGFAPKQFDPLIL